MEKNETLRALFWGAFLRLCWWVRLFVLASAYNTNPHRFIKVALEAPESRVSFESSLDPAVAALSWIRGRCSPSNAAFVRLTISIRGHSTVTNSATKNSLKFWLTLICLYLTWNRHQWGKGALWIFCKKGHMNAAANTKFWHFKKNRLLLLKFLLLVIECLFFCLFQTEYYSARLQLHEQIENICVVGNIQKGAVKIF